MARTLTTAMSNAVDDEVVRPFYLIHMNLDSAPTKTFEVKVVSDSGNKYRFDNSATSAETITLYEGGTYTFDQSDSSNSGHPLRFSTTSNGSHGGGSEYTTGVTTSGTPGNTGAYTRITVASGAATLYYYCTAHSGMGGQANTPEGGALYFWSGVGTYSYDSKSYIGAGNFLQISTIQETTSVQANGLKVGLSGVSSTLITAARDADYQGRVLTVKLGLMDSSNAVISDPVVVFEGFMDVMTISDKGETCEIAISVEHRLIEFDRQRVRRLTDADQQIDHAGDKGFEFIAEIQEKEIAWGVHDGSKPVYGTGVVYTLPPGTNINPAIR